MSMTFMQQSVRGSAPPPTQASIQKMLDENAILIQTIIDHQSKGRASECEQQQHILHRNLVYLASVADANINVQTLLPPPAPGQTSVQTGGHQMRQTSQMAPNATPNQNNIPSTQSQQHYNMPQQPMMPGGSGSIPYNNTQQVPQQNMMSQPQNVMPQKTAQNAMMSQQSVQNQQNPNQTPGMPNMSQQSPGSQNSMMSPHNAMTSQNMMSQGVAMGQSSPMMSSQNVPSQQPNAVPQQQTMMSQSPMTAQQQMMMSSTSGVPQTNSNQTGGPGMMPYTGGPAMMSSSGGNTMMSSNSGQDTQNMSARGQMPPPANFRRPPIPGPQYGQGGNTPSGPYQQNMPSNYPTNQQSPYSGQMYMGQSQQNMGQGMIPGQGVNQGPGTMTQSQGLNPGVMTTGQNQMHPGQQNMAPGQGMNPVQGMMPGSSGMGVGQMSPAQNQMMNPQNYPQQMGYGQPGQYSSAQRYNPYNRPPMVQAGSVQPGQVMQGGTQMGHQPPPGYNYQQGGQY